MQFTYPPDAMFQQIVPSVLNSFSDQDSRVRYYACEALYNIAKVRLIKELVLRFFFLSWFLDFTHVTSVGCARRFHCVLQSDF